MTVAQVTLGYNEKEICFFAFCTDCAGLLDETGYEEQPALDQMPYLTLYYANGPGILGRTDLTGVDTR